MNCRELGLDPSCEVVPRAPDEPLLGQLRPDTSSFVKLSATPDKAIVWGHSALRHNLHSGLL